MANIEGVDYSWARPGGRTLKDAGKQFAIRYIPYPGHGGKGLDAAELADLKGNGISVAMVFESYVSRVKEGFGAGAADATESVKQLKNLGLGDIPVYFAVDWDTTEADQAVIDDYLRGAASVIGLNRVGVYGSYYVCKRCRANGTAKWLWQTYAWSGGQILDGIHLYQYRNGQDLNGAVDFTRALQDNYGQVAGADIPAPSPVQLPQTPSSGIYIVKAGDTLSGIAVRYNTTVASLAAINGISNPNFIQVGQQIRLSGATPVPAPVVGGRYTVVPGDNLTKIGLKFGVSVPALVKANGISDPNKIWAGQVLVIPGSGASPAPAAGRSYTVRQGDTLSGIATRYGTTWQVLKAYNNIPNENIIQIGQVVRIP